VLQLACFLVCLRSGESLIGVDVRALEREHLNEFPPRSLRKPNSRKAHPSLLESERRGDDLGKRHALAGETSDGAGDDQIRIGETALERA
jgi:hypothetical protein